MIQVQDIGLPEEVERAIDKAGAMGGLLVGQIQPTTAGDGLNRD